VELRAINILLIEDNPDDVFLFRETLSEINSSRFSISHTMLLTEASTLLLASPQQFDVAILDLGLLDSQGLNNIQVLQQASPSLPIVVLTGLNDERQALQAVQMGAQDYLTKEHLHPDLLVRAMRHAIERKRMEEELKALNATKDKFFSIISHDLRSPYASLLALSEYLAENGDTFSPSQLKESLQSLHGSAKQLYSLVDQLFTWAATQTEQIEFNPQPLNLSTLIIESLETMHPVAQSKNITLTYHPPAEADKLQIVGDENMLHTVVRNLVSNALKFTPPGGRVRVKIEPEAQQIVVRVQDTGLGIAANQVPKIFDVGQRHISTGTAQERGVGLGLILCQEFIHWHSGQIWVRSQLGQGSEFAFALPKNPNNQK
jgi:signal transduction histidine kinase